MTDQFTPRTVVVVALASLVAGFVTVFGGGMFAFQSRVRSRGPVDPPQGSPEASESPEAVAPETSSDAGAVTEGEDAASPAPVEVAGVTLSPLGISRCFDGMTPTPIAAERCGRLPELDAHFASRASQIAACANGGHGRLAFVMDFRFSNLHVGAWGGPASTIPSPGPVSLCVRRATAPLPLATTPHAHDRYIGTVVIEWQ